MIWIAVTYIVYGALFPSWIWVVESGAKIADGILFSNLSDVRKGEFISLDLFDRSIT